jgi:hypothetical protein
LSPRELDEERLRLPLLQECVLLEEKLDEWCRYAFAGAHCERDAKTISDSINLFIISISPSRFFRSLLSVIAMFPYTALRPAIVAVFAVVAAVARMTRISAHTSTRQRWIIRVAADN